MEHLDPEVVALVALGEPLVDPPALSHVAECASCRDEIAALRSTVSVARSSIGESELHAPPAHVWQAIHAQLGLSPAVASPPMGTSAPLSTSTSASSARIPERAAPSAAAIVQLDAFRERRSGMRRLIVTVAASAAAAALVAGGVLWWGASEPRDAGELIASAQLSALPDWQGASGRATVAERADGARVVRVSLDATVSDDVVREVWLLTENVDGLISLGWLSGSQGEFVIPATVDLAQFSVVDVSAEPIDGDPTHSGDSIVRGSLDV